VVRIYTDYKNLLKEKGEFSNAHHRFIKTSILYETYLYKKFIVQSFIFRYIKLIWYLIVNCKILPVSE